MTFTLQPRLRALVTGLALMALALGGALAALTPASADEFGDEEGGFEEGGDDLGDDATMPADVEEQDLEVTETALYAHPPSDALPPTFTESVPPQVVCVVQPELCPEELRPATDAVGSGIDGVQDNAPVSPVQPVPEGAVAVAYFGGFDRYESALKFELPDIPEGDEVVTFSISFPMEQPSYDMNSPSFRAFVQSVMVAIGSQDPSVVLERLPESLEAGPVDIDGDMIRMEACPLTQPFEPGGAPQASHAEELPREESHDDDELGPPAVDCMLGGTGSYDEEAERWVFDLAFAADAWSSGELENHGVLISPIGVPNLAYGDPDLTTNAQITLDTEDVKVAMDTAEPPPPVEELDSPGELGEMGELGEEPMASDDMSLEDGGGFDDAPSADGFDDGGAAGAPEVADDPGGEIVDEPVDDPEVADGQQLEQAAPAGSEPGTPWWTWLLVPTFAGGAYLVGNAMTASPLAAVSGGERPGAMSRLIASRTGGTPA
jgi:hypothetical protein